MSDWEWKEQPLRFDPSRGYWLCQSCWQGQHFNPAYKDNNGTKHPKVSNCRRGRCGCGCLEYVSPKAKGPSKVRFTGEGQLSIPDNGSIEVK